MKLKFKGGDKVLIYPILGTIFLIDYLFDISLSGIVIENNTLSFVVSQIRGFGLRLAIILFVYFGYLVFCRYKSGHKPLGTNEEGTETKDTDDFTERPSKASVLIDRVILSIMIILAIISLI